MGKIPARGGTTRGGSSIRGGRTRGASGRGSSKSTLAARGGGASPIRNTVATRVVPTNRKGRDPLHRTKDNSMEKNASKESEKKVYKVRLTNVVVKKLIAAKLKGAHVKIKASDKMVCLISHFFNCTSNYSIRYYCLVIYYFMFRFKL